MKNLFIFDKKYLKGFIYFLVILFFSVLIFFVLNKNYLFNSIVNSKILKFEKQYYINVSFKKLYLNGLNNIIVDKLLICKGMNDTILFVDTLYIKISFFKAIVGKLQIKELYSNNIFVNIQKKDSLWNISSFFTSSAEKEKNYSDGFSYKLLLKKMQNIIDFLFSTNASINNISIRINNNEWLQNCISMDTLISDFDLIKFKIKIYDTLNNYQSYVLTFNKYSEKNYILKLSNIDKQLSVNYFPGFSKKELKLSIDTITGILNIIDKNDNINLIFNGIINNLKVYHPYISYKDVQIDYQKVRFITNFSDEEIKITKGSKLQLNNVVFDIIGTIHKDTSFRINVDIFNDRFIAQNLFSSLPDGLFNNLQNLRVKGFLSFILNFSCDFKQIDSLRFNWQLRPHNFSIISWGNFPLYKLNSEFYHVVYENNILVDSILISFKNPYYVSFSEVSPYLISAILCTEDPSFFIHRGFIMESFQESLIENIKRKKIVRGGSTITMQLVKNLFLNRHRVITRKMEEILITWLIENLRLCSKEKIFELYLNIIEFGPKIYGIGKATKFYFNKKPSDLTLNEAIFMASIIPFPKHFNSVFDDSLKVKKNYQQYFNIIANRMFKRNMITEQELTNFNPLNLKIEGKAYIYLNKNHDTLMFNYYLKEK